MPKRKSDEIELLDSFNIFENIDLNYNINIDYDYDIIDYDNIFTDDYIEFDDPVTVTRFPRKQLSSALTSRRFAKRGVRC